MRANRGARSSSATILLVFSLLGSRAEADDFLTLTASINRNHDDNLFRRPSDGQLGSIDSDRVTTTQVGIQLQKPVSLQRFELKAALVDNRYDRFGALNSHSNNHDVTWYWQLTPHISGRLTSGSRQSQTDFADYRGIGQNLRTSRNQRFDAKWAMASDWTLGAGMAETKSTNSQAFVQDDSSRQRITDISLAYLFPAGTSVTLASSLARGEFERALDPVNLRDTHFAERRDSLGVSWPISAKSTLTANGGRVSRNNRTFSARDYSSGYGSLMLNWRITGQVILALGQTRSSDNFEELSSSFSRRLDNSLSASWQISTKATLNARISREKRGFAGSGPVASPITRSDNTSTDSLSLNWAAHSKLTVSTSAQRQRRSSNATAASFDASIISANAAFSF